MTSNKKVVVTSFNAEDILSTLKVINTEIPKPIDGEVLIKVLARPINPADIFSIMGVYPGFTPAGGLPATPGLEGSGQEISKIIHHSLYIIHSPFTIHHHHTSFIIVIIKGQIVDANGTSLSNGQRGVVFFNTKNGEGSWQEYVTVPVANFLPVPDTVSDSSAAQFFVNPVTVYGMLDILNCPKGEYLISSAAGSVLGRQFIAMSKMRNIKTINLVRRGGSAIQELLDIGADYVINTSEEDVVARIKEITNGNGAYGAIDAIAGDITATITSSLRVGGTVLIYGAMSGLEFKGSVVDTLFRSVNISGFWLNVWLGTLTPEKRTQVFGEIIAMLSDGSMIPFSGENFDLSDIVNAVAHSQIPARGGKVLLVSK